MKCFCSDSQFIHRWCLFSDTIQTCLAVILQSLCYSYTWEGFPYCKINHMTYRRCLLVLTQIVPCRKPCWKYLTILKWINSTNVNIKSILCFCTNYKYSMCTKRYIKKYFWKRLQDRQHESIQLLTISVPAQ